jgi:hypothetical protein
VLFALQQKKITKTNPLLTHWVLHARYSIEFIKCIVFEENVRVKIQILHEIPTPVFNS